MRRTKQRDAIQRVFQECNRPLSPEEVKDLAAKTIPGIGIATVYRNLKSLVECETLKIVEIPGTAARYELADLDHHHHFQCNACDKVFDIMGCPGNLKQMGPPGFTVTAHSITLYGFCPDCESPA